jgi:hypothetical protein
MINAQSSQCTAKDVFEWQSQHIISSLDRLLHQSALSWVASALLISFVDDGTIMAQSPTLEANLPKLVRAYAVVHELTEAMGLILKHTKPEGFHFSQKHGDVNPDIDLGYAPYTGATPLSVLCSDALVSGSPDHLRPAPEGQPKLSQASLQSTFMFRSWWNGVMSTPGHFRLPTPFDAL